LAISLFCCLIWETDFERGVLAAVNHSGDSDSTGSITGNILGLINGLSSIPEKWIRNLRYHNIVLEMAEDLHIGIKGDSFKRDQEWWDKYPGYQGNHCYTLLLATFEAHQGQYSIDLLVVQI